MSELSDQLNNILPMPEGVSEWLDQAMQIRRLDRKDFLVMAGRVNRNVYLVRKGLFRAYHRYEGKEISLYFAREKNMFVCCSSFFDGQYGFEYVQALKNSEVYYIDHEQLGRIYREYPGMNDTGRRLMEDYFLRFYRRFAGMWMKEAIERYRWTQRHEGWLLEQIPGKYLASYMGMTPEMFSRIKNGG